MGRNADEMEGVTLLGNKNVTYKMDYAPEMLQTFINKHQDNDYFVKFNCPSLRAFVRLPDSRILQRCIFLMCRT